MHFTSKIRELKPKITDKSFHFIRNGGELGELIKRFDWSKTPLGSTEHWPKCLRLTLSMILASKFPMFLWWGKDLIQFYNDAYRPSLGNNGKHPLALGQKAKDCWPEIWDIIYPLIEQVRNTGESTWSEDQLVPIYRNGKIEDVYWTFGYSPIYGDAHQVEGVLVVCTETTEKVLTRMAVERSEQHFRTMADNIPNLAWMANDDGWIFWYNKKWYDYTGTTPEQMEGWGWQSVHHPQELPRVLISWKDSIATGQPFEMVFPLKGTDGRFRQFLTRVLPVYNNEGKIYQWFGTNTDITIQTEAEQSLKESEQRFRTMAEATDVLIATSDETSNATYFNKAWTDFTGRSLQDLLNFGWADLIYAEDRQAFIDLYLNAFKKQQTWNAELRVLNKYGEYRWLLATGPVRHRPDGSFAGYISSSVDITERKKAEKALRENEENLRNTILQAPVAMCILRGPEYVVELANARMFELWGKTAEQVMHKPIFEGLPEVKGQGFDAMLEGVYKTGESFYAEGVPAKLSRNGKIETVYINFVYEAYHEADDTISGILTVAVDVTAQVIARQKIEEVVTERTKELANANKDLQKSNAELAQFAYIASHDLQEPLRKISTFSQMLENSLGNKIDDHSRKYLNKINYSSARMNDLIRDVLNYSELVKENEIFVEVELNKVLENIKTDYDLLIEQKEATIQCTDLPIVEAIPLQMSQLFGNLVGNALKFARKEVAPVITITASKLSKEELYKSSLDQDLDYYKIQITDNGIGFKKEYANQIFNIFQRLHRKSEYAGTGIGLAMCKKIALNHHGDINAAGSNETGAVFNVMLPVKHVPK